MLTGGGPALAERVPAPDRTPLTAGLAAAPGAASGRAGSALPRFDSVARPLPDEAAQRAASLLHLELRHADGRPADFSPVELRVLGAAPVVGLTDAQGRLSLPGGELGGRLRIGGVGVQPESLELETARGERQVTLPAGRRFAGRVLLEGRPTTRALPIALSGAPGLDRGAGAASGRDALALDVPGLGGSLLDNARRTAPDGTFCFTVPESWTSVHVRVGGHWVPGGSEPWTDGSYEFALPVDDAVVRLWRAPSVYGRVQGADAPAVVECTSWDAACPTAGVPRTVETDASGRFELPLAWFRRGAASLMAFSPGRAERACVRFRVANTSDDIWLSDIFPVPVRRTLVTVLDEDGAPVGRVALTAPGTGLLDAAPTSPQGRARLDWPRDEQQVLVRAPGYRGTQIALDAAQSSAGVVLERTASVDVRVTRADGGTLAGFSVLFEGAREPQAGRVADAPEKRSRVQLPLEGLCGPTVVRLDAIVPGSTVQLSVLDPAGRTCFRAESIELQPGEWRPIEATITDVFRRQEFLVLDEAGKPLEGASVIVTAGSSAGTAAYESNSALRIESLHPGPYDVRVDAPGYQRASFRDVWLDGQGPAREYVLEPARAKSASTCGIVVRRGT